MIEFIEQNNNKNIILFIHGFTGGVNTWKHPDHDSFPSLLSQNKEIQQSYDIAHFSYYTKLFNLFSKSNNISIILKKVLKTSHGKLQKNTSVEEIGNLLRSEIRFKLQNYENIIIVAHSMGGLVAKSSISKDIEENKPSKVRLFISLAVPHMGAELAAYGSLVSKNLQIGDLKPLNSFIHEMNNFWLKTSIRPITKYFYGLHDGVVTKTSASPIDKEELDEIAVDENHTSICKPEGRDDLTLIAVEELILNYQTNDPGISPLEIQTLGDETDYDDELFVLKLIAADINQTSVTNAKEVFLNAEYVRKIFSSDSDQKRLAELYKKIRTIYSNSYTKYLHDGIPNSGLLLADVHEQIMKEDEAFLETLIPFINAIHKQGMLHQLANSESSDIWWSKEAGMTKLLETLEEKDV